ncbi:MAG: hypothetical protein HGA42_20550, partial [Nostocales cyanobacterium W4_Combined_metabat2_030]|nr:hypothetical protein [Nostocales cyanobacterium W4_Combined_metabat2_030]
SWYPSPNINFKFIYDGESSINYDKQENLQVKFTELIPQHRLPAHISRSSYWVSNQRSELFGCFLEPFIQGTTENLSAVVFHIPNFWWFNLSNEYDETEDEQGNLIEVKREGWLMFDGQLIFDYDNWHIVLATLDNCSNLEELLEADGGYGVTHICKLERLGSTPFNLAQANQLIEAFSYYLSFVRGIWIAPILVSGFDQEGNLVLEEWRNPMIKIDSWQDGYRWTSVDDSTDVIDGFPGFMKKWQDDTWKEVIRNAIQWYIESLKHFNGYNSSIILIQAALEKLAWTFLKTNECLTASGFKGLRASEQLRLLLKFLNISVQPLDQYVEIERKAKELNWDDSIVALIEIRNAIVHPQINKSKSQAQFPSEAILEEASFMGHTYLLNCLLKLFEYPYI